MTLGVANHTDNKNRHIKLYLTVKKFTKINRLDVTFKGTLHSVEKNPYTEGLLCLLPHSEGMAIFLCRLTA